MKNPADWKLNDPFDSIVNLVEQTKGGNKLAREKMLNRIRDYLCYVANRRMSSNLKPKASVSDVVQCSLLRINENVEQFSGSTRSEFFAWARKVVINEIHRIERRFSAAKRNVANEEAVRLSTCDALNISVKQTCPRTPQSEVIRNERLKILHEVLNKLPADYSQVIVLRNLEELTFAQVAALLDRSENAVIKLWQRAIERFQMELERLGI
ncbi:MAG: sigma-70 family RNA polymerase sigma factor [Pirellulaceae bacterium]